MSTLVEWGLMLIIALIAWLALSFAVGVVAQAIVYPIMHKSIYPEDKMRMRLNNNIAMAIALALWYGISLVVKGALPELYSSIIGLVIFLSIGGSILMQKSLILSVRRVVVEDRHENSLDWLKVALVENDMSRFVSFASMIACRIAVIASYALVVFVFMLPGLD